MGVDTVRPCNPAGKVRFGVDLYSLRSTGWSPFQYLAYCASLGVEVVHFSEIRFLGGLEEEHLKHVRAEAAKLGLGIEIGMLSICPTSSIFQASQGSAEEQITRMIQAARIVGSPIVRAVVGVRADRTGPLPIEGHIENTVKVLKAVKARAVDAGIKIAIENHAGDMQGRELKMLIEEAGSDFVGACLDAGNPFRAIESPHLTLEQLAPYVLTSHVRDSVVWPAPEGAAVQWVRMGDGNVGIDDYVRRYAECCPGRALSFEIIVGQPVYLNYHDPKFWDGFRNTPAWEFARFVALVEKGTPRPPLALSTEDAAIREQEDLEASIRHTREFLTSSAA